MDKLVMTPAPGEQLLRFVGDRVRFSLRMPRGISQNARALLRTNLGKAGRLRKEIIATHAGKNPMSVAFWRDVPLQSRANGEWSIELPMTDVGFYCAKAYVVDSQGRQFWPEGPDTGISVHPDCHRSANTIYCAFVRMFGESKSARATVDANREKQLNKLDERGYVVIPPSGKLRDVIAQLPHIMETLGCRILQLLPVSPTPATFARFGRFGSPYACLDLTAIDPALVELDQRTTGVEQFCELTHAVHRRGGRVMLDMVINHTGWGSRLFENHPEWFLRNADGTFASPGAWGVTWGDLVELNPNYIELWEEFAQAFLTWCRRGVDGFRCDAGYKVPVQVWQYIGARVREEFPDALFLMEGLGGPLEATEALLTDGGMQWAYSELFQNYTGAEVARYLDYSLRQSGRVGVYVHYSETHDNDRLAAVSREWSLLRNRLCALASVNGAYGFTCGVEWLAEEKFNVHSSRGLSWGGNDNVIAELSQLNHLLCEHPCFFDGATLTRLSAEDSPIYALRRDAAEGEKRVLVLANTDAKEAHAIAIELDDYNDLGRPQCDLLGQVPPEVELSETEAVFSLEPCAVFCLAAGAEPRGSAGQEYRLARAQCAWAISALSKLLLPEDIGPAPWRELAARVSLNPYEFLGALAHLDPARSRRDLLDALDGAKGKFPQVARWSLLDRRRVVPVPPNHWLLLHDSRPFRATLQFDDAREIVEPIETRDGWVACFPPRRPEAAMDARLVLDRYGLTSDLVAGAVRFLAVKPLVRGVLAPPPPDSLVLLTNGRGGMARLCVDLGRVNSKYDCALGANLHSELPVDRHIFVKRLRVWVIADGFLTPLNLRNLACFEMGQPAVWNFAAEAGDGRTVEIELTASMLEGWNTTVFTFQRMAAGKPHSLPPRFDARLTVRVDIEDRNFHTETHRNGGADAHFSRHCAELQVQTGFVFTPAPDRQLCVFSSGGVYHPQPEWSEGISHPIEQSRGQVGQGDAYSPGWFDLPLSAGQPVSLALSADMPYPTFQFIGEASASRGVEQELALKQAKLPEDDSFGRRLALAARAYVARRGAGRTIIAGYPWFLDWGRDSFISARGLLADGMISDVAELLITFGRFEENGVMPNTIHGQDASNRDTSDASLWYGILCEEAAVNLGESLYAAPVNPSGRTVADVLRNIALGYARGTPNGIRMDAASGLIFSPPHFTWMDTNYPACTPREGYPVEIQVLWIRLLRQLDRLGIASASSDERWAVLAERAEESLHKLFWLDEEGYAADCLVAKPDQPASQAVADKALRCNYLMATAFGFFTGDQARRAVASALRYLFVPGAIRTLAPLPVSPPLPIYGRENQLLNNPVEPYCGSYVGDEDTQRKPAYHNGTAWTWPLPMACESLARAWDLAPAAVSAAKAYLGGMDHLLLSGCLGQIPELLDGDAPHQQRGCDAQAWGVTEALRVWKWLQSLENKAPAFTVRH